MHIEDILNRIIEFYILNEIANKFIGIFVNENENIVLKCRVSDNQYKMLLGKNNIIKGSIENKKIVISDYTIFQATFPYREKNYELIIIPAEIIVGNKYFENDSEIKQIMSQMKELNYFSLKGAFSINHNFSKENSAIVNYTYPPELNCQNDKYNLRISYYFQEKFGGERVELVTLPTIEIEFKKNIKIEKAINELASIRILFCFFSDYYIPLGQTYIADVKNNIYLYHMNYIDKIDAKSPIFVINLPMIEKNWRLF